MTYSQISKTATAMDSSFDYGTDLTMIPQIDLVDQKIDPSTDFEMDWTLIPPIDSVDFETDHDTNVLGKRKRPDAPTTPIESKRRKINWHQSAFVQTETKDFDEEDGVHNNALHMTPSTFAIEAQYAPLELVSIITDYRGTSTKWDDFVESFGMHEDVLNNYADLVSNLTPSRVKTHLLHWCSEWILDNVRYYQCISSHPDFKNEFIQGVQKLLDSFPIRVRMYDKYRIKIKDNTLMDCFRMGNVYVPPHYVVERVDSMIVGNCEYRIAPQSANSFHDSVTEMHFNYIKMRMEQFSSFVTSKVSRTDY